MLRSSREGGNPASLSDVTGSPPARGRRGCTGSPPSGMGGIVDIVVPAKAGTQRLLSDVTGSPPARGRRVFCTGSRHPVWAGSWISSFPRRREPSVSCRTSLGSPPARGRRVFCTRVPAIRYGRDHGYRRSREGGNPASLVGRRWVPACAGTTGVLHWLLACAATTGALRRPSLISLTPAVAIAGRIDIEIGKPSVSSRDGNWRHPGCRTLRIGEDDEK